MRRTPIVISLLGLVLAIPAARPDDLPSPSVQAAAIQEHMRKLIDAAEPSIVALVISHHPGYPRIPEAERARGILGDYTSPPPRRFQPRLDERDPLNLADHRNIPDHGYGSGVVVDERGLILTNYHLIDEATKIYVRFADGQGSYADIHAADSRSDLAVLRLITPLRGLKRVKIADVRLTDSPDGSKANVYRGMWVISLAHPFAAGFADGSPSASWGILSNVRRRIPGYGSEEHRTQHLYQYGSLLQTDARLNLGSSGGALLNLDGELIGLTSSLAAVTGSEASGGFAIPITANYRRIVETLMAGREVEYGFLGVSPVGMSQNPRQPGLVISNVTPYTPAGFARLQQGDTIEAIDGIPIREPDDLFLNIGAALADTKVTLKIVDQLGTARHVEVTLAKFLHTHPYIASSRPPAVHGLRVEYSSILTQQLLLAGGRGPRAGVAHVGVIVRELEPNSPAEAAFKKLGNDPSQWMITAVNGTTVTTPDEFYLAARTAPVVRLTVVDATDPADQPRTITLP
jgi:serine protease Do